MKFVIENSTWNNIGDGFYQISLKNIFKKCFPNDEVADLDGPIRRSFRPGKFLGNAFQFNQWQDGDVFVLSGPILNSDFIALYGDLIKNIVSDKKKYCILSSHGDGRNLNENLKFLTQYPPVALTTRDTPTYQMYGSAGIKSLDGVCAASLVSKTCEVSDVKRNKYVTVSFYEVFEPEMIIGSGSKIIVKVGQNNNISRSPKWKYIRHLEFIKNYPKAIGEYEIIRPVHDIGYGFRHLNFARSNSFLSYNPLCYLSLYKGTDFTISNRIHSVLPTLSFGKPALYYGNEKRDAIFARLRINNHVNSWMSISQQFIDDELGKMESFLKQVQWN